MSEASLARIELTGLSLAASQVWGSVRIVPLLRDAPIDDLRLARECWGDVAAVALPDRTSYAAFVPHAFVAAWGEAALGTQILAKKRKTKPLGYQVQRMAKREREDGKAMPRLRFLPMHLAFEGYLALHFAGPDVLRREYSDRVLSQGLSPRGEAVNPGEWIPGLDEALRVFEIREGQVGALLFVADALAAAFVVPHPDDYRHLHRTLLADFYGELIYRYACLYRQTTPLARPIDGARVTSLAELGVELAKLRADWTQFLHAMANELWDQPVRFEQVYRLGDRYRLLRFLPEFRLREANHIGELIRGPAGEVAYLKTFRLSNAQVRRGHLLTQLARHAWDLDACAASVGVSRVELFRRIERAGFGFMLRAHLREAWP